MMYFNGIYYRLEVNDEVNDFDPIQHSRFEIDCRLKEDDTLTALERLLYGFFYDHALQVWNDEEHHPDHDIALKVKDVELSDMLGIKTIEIKEAIQHLIELEMLGVVLLSDSTFAYHVVL